MICMAAAILAAMPFPLLAQQSADSIIKNSNMETDADANGWPDGWPNLKVGGSWEVEEGNHFIRMTSPSPGAMVMLYSEISIPEGVKAIEMTWRQRVTNLKRGTSSWFDARIMMEFKNDVNAKLSPSPSAPFVRKDTGGWQEKSIRFVVPAGSAVLKFMPSLFQVESGTMDIDDIVLKPVAAGVPQDSAADKTPAP